MNACKLFDPFLLSSDIPTESLNLLVDDLKYFGSGFPEFSDPFFIAGLKSEIEEARQHARKPFDWDSIPSAKNYEERLRKRLLRARQRVSETQLGTPEYDTSNAPTGREPTFSNWRDDPGELARRIYGWWKVRLIQTRTFRYYRTALRLVVLCQASSAAAERVFSQLTMIVRICGVSQLEESLELRTMLRCNKSIEEY
jgi:hypothetical protein